MFVEDIRMINVVMMDKSIRRGKAADQRGKYELSKETRAHSMHLCIHNYNIYTF